MSTMTYEDLKDCKVYPALQSEGYSVDYGWAQDGVRLAVAEDGDVLLIASAQCNVLSADEARKLLAQLQDALGVKSEPYLTAPSGRLVIGDGARTVPFAPPPARYPWPGGPITPPWVPCSTGSVTSGKQPGEVVFGHHRCEGGHTLPGDS